MEDAISVDNSCVQAYDTLASLELQRWVCQGLFVCMFPLAPWPARPVHVYVPPCTPTSKTMQCVCMFPLAPRPARPVCVYVPPCTPASKTSSPLHPGQQGQCVCMFLLAPRLARPVCVYVPPCTQASKTRVCVYVPPCTQASKASVCVCSSLHPG